MAARPGVATVGECAIIGIVAIGIAYLTAHAQQANVAVTALSVFFVAFRAWVAITCYRIRVIVTGSRKWWNTRRSDQV